MTASSLFGHLAEGGEGRGSSEVAMAWDVTRRCILRLRCNQICLLMSQKEMVHGIVGFFNIAISKSVKEPYEMISGGVGDLDTD